MKYKDLREFLVQLESKGELKRITTEVSPYLEMTEICDRLLKSEALPLYLKTLKGTIFLYLEICLAHLNVWRWAWGKNQLKRYVK